MPRVNLYPIPGPNQVEGADTRVEVMWDQHSGVRLGTTRLQPGADRHRDFCDGAPGEPMVPAWDGTIVELTRDQVNQLIRNLREARTKVHGRDE